VCVTDKYQDLQPWYGPKTVDITYPDTEGKLTELLVGSGHMSVEQREKQQALNKLFAGAGNLKYYIEVKTTTRTAEEKFPLSGPQYSRVCYITQDSLRESLTARKQMQDMSNTNLFGSRSIYVIFRVYSLGKPNIGMKIYLDPEELRRDGKLDFTTELWSVRPSDPSQRSVFSSFNNKTSSPQSLSFDLPADSFFNTTSLGTRSASKPFSGKFIDPDKVTAAAMGAGSGERSDATTAGNSKSSATSFEATPSTKHGKSTVDKIPTSTPTSAPKVTSKHPSSNTRAFIFTGNSPSSTPAPTFNASTTSTRRQSPSPFADSVFRIARPQSAGLFAIASHQTTPAVANSGSSSSEEFFDAPSV
jgi:hypothetical protein